MLDQKLLKGMVVLEDVGVELVKTTSHHVVDSSEETYSVMVHAGGQTRSNPEDSLESEIPDFSFEISKEMYQCLLKRRKEHGTRGRIIFDFSRGYTDFAYERK